MGKLRILLVDDQPLVRDALRALIDEQTDDMEVVGEAQDGQEALALAPKLAPDVTLLDMTMPGLSSVEVAQRLEGEVPGTKILALSANADEGLARQMFAAGADGYALKSESTAELLRAIRQVAAGERYVAEALAEKLGRRPGP
jgi:DNA-binding NarL/FixJ family response regulator